MSKKFFKELFIIILLLIVVMFTLGLLFYDNLSVDAQKIDSVSYMGDAETGKIINEIEKNGSEENSELNVSRSVSKEDLELFRTQNSFETGKKNPFSESSDVNNTPSNPNTEIVSDDNTNKVKTDVEVPNTNVTNVVIIDRTNTVNTNNTINTKKDTTNTTNTTKETTGRFFENKTSK